jgi:hypothetical protein
LEIDGDFVSRMITIKTFSFKIDLRKAIIVSKQLVVIRLFKAKKVVNVASDFKENKLI